MADFTAINRKNDLTVYMHELSEKLNKKFESNTLKYFKKSKLAEGIEGVVYKSTFKDPQYFFKKIAIKVIDVEKVIDAKGVDVQFLTTSPTDVYKKFFDSETYDSESIVSEPLFTEVYSFTLINQMIYQNICPHYIQNYSWEFSKQKTFNIYNEFVNGGDFYSFLNYSHSDEVWYNVLFQIMYTIISYRKYFDMVHGDLHTGNILIHKVSKGGYWKYTVNGKNYYLPNLGFVFIINDFGFASIKDKMHINWFYRDTLKYLTENGREFYDLQNILGCLEYSYVSKGFVKTMRMLKNSKDLKFIYTSDYPKRKKNYPNNIDINYRGTGKKLIAYFSDIFENMYSTEPKPEDILDSYSLDKNYIPKFPKEYSYFENFIVEHSKHSDLLSE
jgi:hypothetical protein